MDLLNAILLGIIQGLTEFLPVSSSGHLELAKLILGQDYEAKSSMLMTVVLHAATAIATVVVYRKEVLEIFRGLFQFKWNEEAAFSVKIIISMIPAAIVGILLEDEIEALFSGNLLLVGSCLIATGLLLFLADRAKNTDKSVGFAHALLIGISQAIAILPGISRSGATISTSVLLGIDRSKAARFSFLMVVPLILGKMAKDIMDGDLTAESTPLLALSVGFVAAFITGVIACTWMISLVRKAQLSWFAIYCLLVGAGAIFYQL